MRASLALSIPSSGGVMRVPYTVPGLVYWLDPERYADPIAPWTLNGTKVASAPSRESTAGVIDATKTATQGTDANRPTLNTSDAAYGGRATLSFAGGTQGLLATSWGASVGSSATVYIVYSHTGTGYNARIAQFSNGAAETQQLVYVATGTGVISSGAGVTNDTGGSDGAPRVLCNTFNVGSSAIYINNPSVAVASGAVSANGPGIVIGNSYLVNSGITGKIATVLVYSGAHDEATRTRIMQWLSDRYGFDRSLTPYTVGGLAYWLDPDRYADPSGPGAWTLNGSKVATAVSRHSWARVADTSKNVTQATDGNRPTINVSDVAFGGKNTLSFSAAASQYLQSGAWTTSLSQPLTTYAVFVDTGDTSVNRHVYDGIATGNKHALFAASITGNATITAGTLLAGASVSDSAGKVTCAVYNGASSALYINNSSSSSASGNAGTNTLTGITLGTLFSAVGQFAQGKLVVLLVYSGAHTAAQRALIMQWLGARYGITVT